MIRWRLLLALAIVSLPSSAAAQSADRDCADFSTRIAAQQALDDRPGDPWNLDADNDGDACEWTQQKRVWSFFGGLVGLGIGGYLRQRREGENADTSEALALVILGGLPMLAVVWAASWITPPAWDHVGVALATGLFCGVVGWFVMEISVRRG
jgi:hypothetical protein